MFFSEGFGFDGQSNGAESKGVDNEELYNALGVSNSATPSEIKKAYYGLAKKHHPDKGGDEMQFKKIQLAFEVLKDPEKRQVYDKYGEAGLRGEAESAGMSNIFDLISGRRRGPRKGKNSVSELKVSLEEIYNQAKKKLRLTKDALCEACKGAGTKSGKSTSCGNCRGSGVVVELKRIGNNMVQQIQRACGDCGGTGENIGKNDRCGGCRGRKIVERKKIVEVLIEKGVETGHKITFPGEADERPGILPGDVVVVIREKPHGTFTRKGMNLFMKKLVTLSEALCGAEFAVQHLDGRVLKISTAGSVVSPREVRCVENEGMPLHSRPFVKGALFIDFVVKFPAEGALSRGDLDAIKKLLKQPALPLSLPKDHVETELVRKSVEKVQQEQRVYHNMRADDESDEEMGSHTTCQTQ